MAYGEEVNLTYLPGQSAIIKAEVHSDWLFKIGSDKEVMAASSQWIESEVKVANGPPDSVTLDPSIDQGENPLNLTFKLLTVKVELDQGHSKKVYDLNDPSINYFFAELKQLKNNPLSLVIREPEKSIQVLETKHSLINPSEELIENRKEFRFIFYPLQTALILAGQPLKEGMTYETEIFFGDNNSQKGLLSFQILKITDNEIVGPVAFSIKRQKLEKEGSYSGTGELKGLGRFSRYNPLDFQIDLEGEIKASLKTQDLLKAAQLQNVKIKIYSTGAL